MRREGRNKSLNNLRRQEPKETAAKGCSGCGQTERADAERPAPKEAEESRVASPPRTCKEERTDATCEEKALSAVGPEGRKRFAAGGRGRTKNSGVIGRTAQRAGFS